MVMELRKLLLYPNSLGPVGVDSAPTPPKRSKESSASTLMSLLGPVYAPKATVPQKTPADKAREELNRHREVNPVPLHGNPLTWRRAELFSFGWQNRSSS